MKFECNCKTDNDLKEMVKNIHDIDSCVNWEVGARFWLSNMDETIMIEYQIMTQYGKQIFESPNEPDWFTAYLVEDETDNNCKNEIDSKPVKTFTSLEELQDAMDQFANNLMS